MARYEFRSGTSSKFWDIELSASAVTTRWGRIGTDGQAKTKKLASPKSAQAEYDKLVREKLGKGYVAVSGKGAKRAKPAKPAKPAASKNASPKSASPKSATSKSAPRKSASLKSASPKSATAKAAPEQPAAQLVPHLKMVLKKLDKNDARICDRLGGSPNRWTDDAPWPICARCKQPMQFVVQLLGESAGGQARIGAASCVQVFACYNTSDCEFYALGAGSNHAALRHQPLAPELRPRDGGNDSGGEPLRVARAISFKPGHDDVEALMDDEHEARQEKAHSAGFTDKLYGVPVAGNEPRDVSCTRCQKPLAFLGQILSADDWFIYYLHVCAGGHEVRFHARRS